MGYDGLIIIRLAGVIICLLALHFSYNIQKKSLQDWLWISFSWILLIHNAFVIPIWMVSFTKYFRLDILAPFALFYAPLFYFYFLAGRKGKIPKKKWIIHGLPIVVMWFIFIINAVFMTRLSRPMQLFSAFILQGSLGISLISYSVYMSRKKMVPEQRKYLAWFCGVAGLYIFYFSFVRWKGGNLGLPPAGVYEIVSSFLVVGAIIAMGESLARFRDQYLPMAVEADAFGYGWATQRWNQRIFGKVRYSKIKELESFFASRSIENRELGLKGASESLMMTQKELKQVIRRHYDTTFSKLLTQKRIELACKKVMSPEFKGEYGRLASDCGFGSRATFYRNFQELKGCTPRQYRKREKQPQRHG